MFKPVVIIPTYNEKENILPIIAAVFQHNPEVNILVVDDGSPDGTATLVETQMRSEKRLHLLLRTQKEGLGKAYVAGFKWCLAKGFTHLVEMDADFSHRPEDLVKILKAAAGNDFVIGSRYVSGGSTVNWGILRKIISRGGGIYSRLILGYPVQDWTGGFNLWAAPVLQKVGLDEIRSNGYSFQIELKFRGCREGFKYQEVPIVFEDRRVGKSKMSLKIVLEAFYKVWLIKFSPKAES